MYEYFDEMKNGSFLEHHGILGQKWGIRRFQNYDGTLKNAGKKRRAKTDKDKALVKEERAKARAERREARAAEKAEKAQKKAEEEAAKFEETKKKAIAEGDIDTILKLRGSLTTAELKDAAQRQLAIKQLNDFSIPKKTALEKFRGVMSGGKETLDSITNMHKSIASFKEEFGLGKKKESKQAPAQKQQESKNQNNHSQQNDETAKKLDKIMSQFETKLAQAQKQAQEHQQKQKQNKQESQPKKEKAKDLDLWEDETKNGPVDVSSWSAPKAEKKNLKISNFTTAFGKTGKVFSDTDSFGYQRPTSNSKFSWDKVTSMAREKTLSEVNARNSSGWTAKNNDDWLAVLKSANEMKAHNIVYDSKRKRYV